MFRWLKLTFSLPGIEITSELWKIFQKFLQLISKAGMYEVLEYETILELKDRKGKLASFHKREKVRFLQDNVIAYQDQAWGDGKILLNYHCSPGKPVDQYRSGYKTYILISLREVKNRGDIETFDIKWDIRDGFLKPHGFWATEISHPTDKVKVQVIFPKSRPPSRITLLEKNRQKSVELNKDVKKRLSDGRWSVLWECHRPRVHEQYLLNWEW